MSHWKLALVTTFLSAAACGPAQPPDPECTPGGECVAYEIGTTTGRMGEQINPDVPLETYAPTNDQASEPARPANVAPQPLSGGGEAH